LLGQDLINALSLTRVFWPETWVTPVRRHG